MSYDTPDVYNQPEQFGLTIIGELSDPDASYSFDELVVWQHKDERLFYAQDSGCSCPSPFEDFTSLDSLSEITDQTYEKFRVAVDNHAARDKWSYAPDADWQSFHADKTQLLAKVARLLLERKS
jgi:hypothetical protein